MDPGCRPESRDSPVPTGLKRDSGISGHFWSLLSDFWRYFSKVVFLVPADLKRDSGEKRRKVVILGSEFRQVRVVSEIFLETSYRSFP